MAKTKERIRVRELRKKGLSIGEILKEVSVSRSTVSLWIRDIKLTQKQINRLLQRAHSGWESSRLKWAETQKQKRIADEERLRRDGLDEIGNLTDREFFLTGIALYWAEGYKASRSRFGIVNSDPRMVLFMFKWMKKTFRLSISDFIPRVGINISHKNRVGEVEKYWSNLLKIPLKQFRKTSFKHYKSKKKYENFYEHYGTLSLEVRKATEKVRKMKGWIEGLAVNGSAGKLSKRLGSSVGRAGES